VRRREVVEEGKGRSESMGMARVCGWMGGNVNGDVVTIYPYLSKDEFWIYSLNGSKN